MDTTKRKAKYGKYGKYGKYMASMASMASVESMASMARVSTPDVAGCGFVGHRDARFHKAIFYTKL